MTPEVLELKFLSKNFKKKIVGVSQSLRLLQRQGDDASIPLSVLPPAHRWNSGPVLHHSGCTVWRKQFLSHVPVLTGKIAYDIRKLSHVAIHIIKYQPWHRRTITQHWTQTILGRCWRIKRELLTENLNIKMWQRLRMVTQTAKRNKQKYQILYSLNVTRLYPLPCQRSVPYTK